MITNYQFNSFHDRSKILDIIKEGKLKAIDIGGATSFADGHLDAIVDIGQPLAKSKHVFLGNINLPETWEPVLEHVKKHGKWDFAICTHTLEDISNPLMVCRYIERIAKAGFIAFPSKYYEFGRFGVDTYRGFIHHRWIFDMVDGELVGYPKINYVEHKKFDAIAAHPDVENRKELSLLWEGEIGLKLVNDDFLGPNEEAVMGYYDELLKFE